MTTPAQPSPEEAKDLADRIWRSFERDHGRHWLLWMGESFEKVNAMTDDELIAISREVASWPRKEPETCPECGQDLPGAA